MPAKGIRLSIKIVRRDFYSFLSLIILKLQEMKKILFLFVPIVYSLSVFGQHTLKGKIKNAQDQTTLPNATIVIEGLLNSVASDLDGNYRFKNLKPGTYSLKVSYIGFKTLTKEITVNNDSETDIFLEPSEVITDEVIVSALRVGDKTPVAFGNITKEELVKRNLGQDLPYLLNSTPSTVVSSDAGNGVGYTGIKIRGTDATRINVTVNGIPLNDAESQGVFWVNMPDFASSINSIQIQRGVGTSTSGAGAFGASINIQTTTLNKEAYTEIANSFGSFNTIKNTVNIGSGLINNKFNFEGRLSRISSDGYVQPGWSDLKSYYLSGSYYGKKSALKLTTFGGKEKTYQAWNGLRDTILAINRRANLFSYSDQTDNYWQDHYQLHYNYELTKNITLNSALHYTKGRGYYEEYREEDNLNFYKINPVLIGNDTIKTSDLIRRRWLDNDFYGGIWNLNYNSDNKKLNVIWGGGYNQYIGAHFGEVIWARFASNSNIRQKYYRDSAFKNDMNTYLKINYQLNNKLFVFTDLQYRNVGYEFMGYDRNLNNISQSVNLNFINPKVGITYSLTENQQLYTSYAVANKEPNRDDYTNSSQDSRPKHENLKDIEAGYKFNTNTFAFGLNIYNMVYKNQLVLTGKINDVGSYTRTNVKESYRRGVEIEAGGVLHKKVRWNGNLTFSENKVKNFLEYYDNYDNFTQDSMAYTLSDIAFSPSLIASSIFILNPIKNLDINIISKYVGKQYLDNTSNNNRIINPFLVNDLRIDYKINTLLFKEIRIGLLAANFLNELYENNGYTFSYVFGGVRTSENFYYPQAGRNFMASLAIRF
jgi:iron complex outermembrane receptor protein